MVAGSHPSRETYFSPQDIEKGKRWRSEIAAELHSADVGLICLTPENLTAGWILFEAGALSKHADESRVCAILLGGLKSTDVKDPLAQFQYALFAKDEIEGVLNMINAALDAEALPPQVLKTVFEKFWPDLERQVAEAMALPAPRPIVRSKRDLLEEILGLVRSPSRHDQTKEVGLLYRLQKWGSSVDGGGQMVAQVTLWAPFVAEVLQYHSYIGYQREKQWLCSTLEEAFAKVDAEGGFKTSGAWQLAPVRLPG